MFDLGFPTPSAHSAAKMAWRVSLPMGCPKSSGLGPGGMQLRLVIGVLGVARHKPGLESKNPRCEITILMRTTENNGFVVLGRPVCLPETKQHRNQSSK